MATLYWYGGTGNWSDFTNHWSNNSGNVPSSPAAAAPTSADDVVFDSASNATAYTVTIDATANCKNFTLGAPASGKVTWAGSAAMSIYGNINLSGGTAGITRTYTGTITFASTATGKTITANGVVLASPITFNGVGGGWQFQDTWNSGLTNALTLTNGTIDFNNQTVTTGAFSSNNTNTRRVILGSATWNVGQGWTVNSSGITWDTNTATVNIGGGVQNPTFTGGNVANYNKFVFTANQPTFADANTFAELRLTPTSVAYITLKANQTVSGAFYGTGFDAAANRLLFQSDIIGTQRTISAGSIGGLTNVDFMDIAGAGAATWTGTSIGDCGGNSNITFTTPVTRYWAVHTGGSYSSTSSWSSVSSSGATGASVPLPQDTAVFDSGSITSGSRTITVDLPRVGTLDFHNVTNSPNVTFSGLTNIVGSLDLRGINTYTATSFTFCARTAQTLYSNSKSFGSSNITVNAPGGGVTFQDALSSTANLVLTLGSLDANNQNVTCAKFISNTAGTRSLNLGNGTWTITGTGTPWDIENWASMTLTCGTSTIKFTNSTNANISIEWGPMTYNNVWFARGASTGLITNNSSTNSSPIFNDYKDDGSAAHSLSFGTASNSFFTANTWTIAGAVGAVRGISSNSAGVKAILVCPSGTINLDYMTVQDIVVGGGAVWNMGANSTNTSGNAGWADQKRYWVAGGTGNWNSTTNWSAADGGSSGASVPDGHNVYFTSNSGSGTSTVNAGATITDLDMTGFAGTLAGSSALTVYGNIKFASTHGLTYTGGITLARNERSKTLTAGTKTILSNITYGVISITIGSADVWTLQDAWDMTGKTVTHNLGKIDLNNNNLTSGTYATGGSGAKSIAWGSGTWALTSTGTVWSTGHSGTTLYPGTGAIKINDTSNTAITFAGGSVSNYPQLWHNGGTSTRTITVTGSNGFADIKDSGTGTHTWKFDSSGTITVADWHVSGIAGHLISLISSVAGTAFNLVKTGGGVVSADYLSVKDSAASPGSTFYAGTHSTNVSGNTGWTFTDPPVVGGVPLRALCGMGL